MLILKINLSCKTADAVWHLSMPNLKPVLTQRINCRPYS